MDVSKMNLSLNGCGYLGIYHVGVCSCIKLYRPEIFKNEISGGSVGALVACAFLCDVPLEICTKYVFDVSMKVRNGILGPMTPDLNIMRVLYESMDIMLPADAHLHCDGKLHVSVTRYDNGENVLLSNFNSREELLQALMCSCFIPVYCGYQPPLFHGVAYVDAALSNNSPWLNKDTVTVAPFSGNSDICPENDGIFLKSFTLSNTSIGLTAKNLYMLFRVLFPGSPDIQKEFCFKGFNDGCRFLHDNDLMSCNNCTTRQNKSAKIKSCKIAEKPLPVEISNEIEAAINLFKKNFGYRIFQYRSVKMLYYINMPSIVTAKVTYVILSAIFQKVHNKAGSCVDDLWSHFLQILKDGILRESNSHKVACHIEDVEKNKKEQESTLLKPCVTEAYKTDSQYSSTLCNGTTSSDSRFAGTSFEIKLNEKICAQQRIPNGKTYSHNLQNNKFQFSLSESENNIKRPDVYNTYIY